MQGLAKEFGAEVTALRYIVVMLCLFLLLHLPRKFLGYLGFFQQVPIFSTFTILFNYLNYYSKIPIIHS